MLVGGGRRRCFLLAVTVEGKEADVSLKNLLEAGAHFGHQVRRWNPRMKPYIYAVRDDVHIFDLEITARKLAEAAAFLRELGQSGGNLLMVGTKRQAIEPIKEAAEKSGAAYITKRWVGGLLTNWGQVSKNIARVKDFEEKRDAGEFDDLTKLERLKIDREIAKLEAVYGGMRGLEAAPDALFIIDVHREKTALREAIREGINVVGVCDSNADPEGIKYVIPGNDDAVKAIALYCRVLGEAYKEGRRRFAAASKKGSALK
jgi:small subunit ribosomal protein S2